MNNLELMEKRHSVRQYKDTPIEEEKRIILDELVSSINEKEGLSISLLYEEPECFSSFMARYGKFDGIKNYVSLSGPKGKKLEEKLGYFGEQIALKIQELGMNSCFVALTHGKSKAKIEKGHKECCLICFGYGASEGFPHKAKAIEKVSNFQEGMPSWFKEGVEAALLAPTALNQQKFYFELKEDGSVTAKPGTGFYTKLDLGIAKYHFELVSGHKVG